MMYELAGMISPVPVATWFTSSTSPALTSRLAGVALSANCSATLCTELPADQAREATAVVPASPLVHLLRTVRVRKLPPLAVMAAEGTNSTRVMVPSNGIIGEKLALTPLVAASVAAAKTVIGKPSPAISFSRSMIFPLPGRLGAGRPAPRPAGAAGHHVGGGRGGAARVDRHLDHARLEAPLDHLDAVFREQPHVLVERQVGAVVHRVQADHVGHATHPGTGRVQQHVERGGQGVDPRTLTDRGRGVRAAGAVQRLLPVIDPLDPRVAQREPRFDLGLRQLEGVVAVHAH